MNPEASQQKNPASPACEFLIELVLCCDFGNEVLEVTKNIGHFEAPR